MHCLFKTIINEKLMIKKALLIALCLTASLVMTAAHITPEQARKAAEQFLKQKVARSHNTHPTAIKQVKAFSPAGDDIASVYAVNLSDNNGFVLVGGNSQSNEIIGYCDHGNFDPETMPSNMRAWLNSYVATASHVKDIKKARSQSADSQTATKSPITPLLKSKWSQLQPYNNDCPVIDDKRCPTGCTITAMAQIMYYHRWPVESSTAIPSYAPSNSNGTNYPTLPALEPTTFDWDKMYNTYDNNEDGGEVAKLMKYLGTASHALYGKNETGAYCHYALQAIIQYFNYDAGARPMWRRQMSYDQWIDKLYTELQAKRPVMFSGSSITNGHTFVVDGYDEEDFFHINWGWGGTSDGYYRVIFMDPKEQGTGGSASNEAYSYEQVAYFGIQPNTSGQAYAPRLTVLSNWIYTDPQNTGDYDTHSNEFTSPFFDDKGYLVYAAMNGHNLSAFNAEFSLGCRLIKNDGSVTRDYEWDHASTDVDGDLKNQAHTVYLNPLTDPALTDGDYRLYFTSKLKSATTWQLDDGSDDHYIDILLNHAGGKLIATSVSREAKLTVNEVIIHNTTPMAYQPIDATITVTNNGIAPYHGDIGLSRSQEKDETQWLSVRSCDIAPGETANVNLTFTPKTAGTINYNVLDNIGNNLYSGSVAVSESNITSNIDLTITHEVTNASGTVISAPKALIDVTVTNDNDKTYLGEITIYCLKWTGEHYKYVYDSRMETIPAHQTVVLHRESPELTGAEYYSFSTMYMKGDEQVNQESSDIFYTTGSYYLTYDASGKATTHSVTSQVQPDATVCAIDLTKAPEVNSVNSADNPNMIVIAADDSPLSGDNIIKGTQAERVKLVDGYPFYTPITFTASEISYTSTVQAQFETEGNKGWSTIVLPFAATSCHATIAGVPTPLSWSTTTTDGDIMIATFQYENGSVMKFGLPELTLEACHPYLLGVPATLDRNTTLNGASITFSSSNAQVKASKAVITGRDYKMMGTFSFIKDMDNIFTLNAEGSAFIPASEVNPFNAYFMPIGATTPASTLSIIIDDGITGINELTINKPNWQQNPCYNLGGQRVTRPEKGIYIIGGKKVIF